MFANFRYKHPTFLFHFDMVLMFYVFLLSVHNYVSLLDNYSAVRLIALIFSVTAFFVGINTLSKELIAQTTLLDEREAQEFKPINFI